MSRIQLFAAWLMAPSLMIASASAQSLDTPMTRLRPIGSPSAVDKYRPPTPAPLPSQSQSVRSTLVRETAYQAGEFGNGGVNPVRQAAMQQFEAPNLPLGGNAGSSNPNGGGSFALPPGAAGPGAVSPGAVSPGAVSPGAVSPGAALPGGGLPGVGNGSPGMGSTPPSFNTVPPPGSAMAPVPMDSATITSSGDLTPIAPPQIGTGFATIDNCNCVSGPSTYMAASTTPGCVPISYQGPVQYQPVSQIAVPAGVVPAGAVRGDGIPRGPLFSFGQDRNPVQVGQGIVGQPVAYVPGQRFRNWIRYIFP